MSIKLRLPPDLCQCQKQPRAPRCSKDPEQSLQFRVWSLEFMLGRPSCLEGFSEPAINPEPYTLQKTNLRTTYAPGNNGFNKN